LNKPSSSSTTTITTSVGSSLELFLFNMPRLPHVECERVFKIRQVLPVFYTMLTWQLPRHITC
jgi:hypothetical protein